jgi:hypothetical protein
MLNDSLFHAFMMPYEGQSHFAAANDCRNVFIAAGINYVEDPSKAHRNFEGDFAVSFESSLKYLAQRSTLIFLVQYRRREKEMCL